MEISDDQVVGYRCDDGLVCKECLTETDNISSSDNLLTEQDVDDDTHYFCDRCSKTLR